MMLFLAGVGGAFCVYFAIYRHHRLKTVYSNIREFWPSIFFDLFMYLLCGGIVGTVLAARTEEACLYGAMWQGFIGLAIAKEERHIKEISEGSNSNEH